MKSSRHRLVKRRRGRGDTPARLRRRPIPSAAATRAAPEFEEFDLSVVHAVDGAAPADLAAWYEDRRERGADRHDEVWQGVYIVAPDANTEHQRFATRLATVFDSLLATRADIYAGVNVSDRDVDWSKDFRDPDVAVVFRSNAHCEDRGSHLFGGPDLVVEVESRRDNARLKFDFYARIRVREFLIVEYRTRRPLLYRLKGPEFVPVAEKAGWVASRVVPFAFTGGGGRLSIRSTRRPVRRWVIGR